MKRFRLSQRHYNFKNLTAKFSALYIKRNKKGSRVTLQVFTSKFKVKLHRPLTGGALAFSRLLLLFSASSLSLSLF